MPKEITSLTKEQKDQLSGWIDKWVANSISTEPANFKVAEEAALKCYDAIKYPRPNIVLHMSSPYACIIGGCLASYYWKTFQKEIPNLNEIVQAKVDGKDFKLSNYGVNLSAAQMKDLNEYIKTNWYNYRGANLWSSWIACVTYFRDVCGWENEALENFKLDETISTNCGLVWFSEECVAISDRPMGLFRNNANRLHNDRGMALEYRDGWGIYSWHGYRIPDDKTWIIADKSRLNPLVIEKETNAEIRRIMLEIYGFDKYLEQRGAKVVHEDEVKGLPRRLMDIEVLGETIRVIEVNNGSLEPDGTRRKFVLGCVRNNNQWPKTCAEAIAWSYGISPKVYNESVRT